VVAREGTAAGSPNALNWPRRTGTLSACVDGSEWRPTTPRYASGCGSTPRSLHSICGPLGTSHRRRMSWPSGPPRATSGHRRASLMRWGLVPAWAKTLRVGSTFNARADGVTSKPTFRGAWRAGRRCLMVADGFYEWRESDRQPYAVGMADGGLMACAGLLAPRSPSLVTAWQVGRRVGNVRNDDAGLVEPLGHDEARLL
jgi:hypothetical protein